MNASDDSIPGQRRVLVDHLDALAIKRGMSAVGTAAIALGVLDEPQSHVDILVAAGVLEVYGGSVSTSGEEWVSYRVVQPEPPCLPHEHVWRVAGVVVMDPPEAKGLLTIECQCGADALVANKVPIELPHYEAL